MSKAGNTRGLQSTDAGKRRLRDAYKEAGLTQQSLAEKAKVSLDTIKRLLGTKECSNGVDRWSIENVAKVLGLKPTDIVDAKDWNDRSLSPPYPTEFKSLIEEKISLFCGRKWVFAAFDRFLEKNNNGYFSIVGDAGMGKSSIAAKYVFDNNPICYFNVQAEGRNRGERFLESVRQQLIERYDLENAERDDLAQLLAKTSLVLKEGDRLVIVVDALDEVEEDIKASNILNLPTTLPEKVYFLLTRRPYTSYQKRLFVSVATEELSLSNDAKDEIAKMNRDDVKEYIRLFLNEDPEYRDTLGQWMENRQISREDFVELLAEKSENNFMYLRYVLPAIARGEYNDLNIKDLPEGLIQYYEQHWVRMGMTGKSRENATILFVLVKAGKAISGESIAEAIGRDENEVLEVLEEWRGFLKNPFVEGEECYAIYHQSFADFLQQKPTIKRAAKLLSDNNDRFWEQLAADEGEEDEEE